MVGCDELGCEEHNEHTEGQPDVVPIIESSAQNDQRVTVTCPPRIFQC